MKSKAAIAVRSWWRAEFSSVGESGNGEVVGTEEAELPLSPRSRQIRYLGEQVRGDKSMTGRNISRQCSLVMMMTNGLLKMKTSLAAILTTGLLFAGVPVLAANKDSIRFDATITADEIVNKTCTVLATMSGMLAPNADMNVLSSLLPGGRPGKISVTTGNIEIRLSTSNDRLLKGDGDEPAEIENVVLSTGLGVINADTLKSIFDGGYTAESGIDKIAAIRREAERPPAERNAATEFDVYFVASLPKVDPNMLSENVGSEVGPGIFLPDTYKGLTTVTCEPAG